MNDRMIGQVKRVNGPVIEVMGITDAEMFELVRVGKENLIGELIKLEQDSAVVQVYEDTTGIAPHDPVYGAGMQLSVELGPGMIGTIYDGIQRPLEAIQAQSGIYIERGITVHSLTRDKKWHFCPSVKAGDTVTGGMILGTVQETENLLHKILVPPQDQGSLVSVVPEGDYSVEFNGYPFPPDIIDPSLMEQSAVYVVEGKKDPVVTFYFPTRFHPTSQEQVGIQTSH